MAQTNTEIRIRGKTVQVPSVRINDLLIVVVGRWIRMANVHDEEWIEGDLVQNPGQVIRELKLQGLPADIFTFFEKPPATATRYSYYVEWDNFAAMPTSDFKYWWEKVLPQETRKNVRLSAKRGVNVRTVELNDKLIQGVTEIYNETPFRQGRRFPHYGKSFETVKTEISTFPANSEFIGAYFGDELIGFIKLLHIGKLASILHIVSKNGHYDKKPTNALICKAAEICHDKGRTFLLYGKYNYGNKLNDPLVEFKRRNGFEKILVPRYYIPLTIWGSIVLKLKLQRGLLGLFPPRLIDFLVGLRTKLLQLKQKIFQPPPGA